MISHLSRAAGFLGLLLGLSEMAAAQVPKHPDRIRETTQAILSQPEFRLFPRLNPGETDTGESVGRTGQGGVRFKSSRGVPQEQGEKGGAAGNGQGANGNGPPERGPNGELLNGPGGNANGENPQNAEEALGRNGEFPEAGKLDKLLEEPGFNANPNPRRPAEELENANPQNGEALAENAPNPDGNNPAPEAVPKRPRAEEFKPNRDHHPAPPTRIRGGSQPAENDALPAPRPRQRRESDGESSLAMPAPNVSALARVVGAVFHILAWAILTIICGMILWLIIKAIRERERPLAFAKFDDGKEILDLEPAQAPGDFPADVYVAQALRLAEEGRYREAVVQLVLGAMSRVERAGWVRFRRGMTVRDYLRSLYDHPAAHQGFHSIVRVFEPVTFGRREPTREHFDQSLKGYELGFGLE